ncbi:acyl-CoA dehydrogenase family protein [Streptomyces sp. NPDC102384]|uniref:acyl-CoA dehydrogenase family protein n=1 Tax=Streptomyces sp. NPDC102384 TaxID=3366166 RepID=UPI003820614F
MSPTETDTETDTGTDSALAPAPTRQGVDPRAAARALATEWREAGRYTPRSDAWLRSFDRDFSRELAGRGMTAMTWPVEYGGHALRNVDRLAVTEELLRAGAPVAAHWIGDRQIGPAILRHGSPALKEEILPRIAATDAVFCLGMSEPEAGSDLASVRTTARRVAGGWRLSGHKIWTSHAHHATHAYVLARTTPREDVDRKHQGLSEFVVDMDADGVSTGAIPDLAGEHHFNEVRFEDVYVPEGRLIGTEGEGWRQVVGQLSFERGGAERVLSSYPVLVALLAEAARPARAGAVVPDTIAASIGSLTARLTVLRRLCWDVASAMDRGETPVRAAAALKYLGNAFENDVVEAFREASGGLPPTAESDFGQALLAAPAFGLRGGASDVLLSLIAREETRA